MSKSEDRNDPPPRATLEHWEAFGRKFLKMHALTPQHQATAREIHELLPDEPCPNYGWDFGNRKVWP